MTALFSRLPELIAQSILPIRVRPTGEAAEPAKPVPLPPAQSKAPLGTTLASSTRCPQSGTRVCDRPDTFGGTHRYYTEGEMLSSVLVHVERSFVQKLKGVPQNRLAETVWTLASLADERPRS